MSDANKNLKAPFFGYYSTIARICGCSSQYVKNVLRDNLGKYSERETELVVKIREKAEELKSVLKAQ